MPSIDSFGNMNCSGPTLKLNYINLTFKVTVKA